MSDLFVLPRQSVFDGSGDPLSGGKLGFFETGTSTELDTFSDDSLTTANANPVVADSAGRFGAIFMKDQDYKVVLSDSDDVEIWSADPVRGGVDNIADDTFRTNLSTAGSANAYTLASNRTFSAYASGQVFIAKASFENSSAATLNVTPAGGAALGAKSIVKNHDQALVAGDIENGQFCTFIYDGTNFQLLSPLASSKRLVTEQATTSGTAIDFTSIPAWVTRITVMLVGVSTDGTDNLLIQLGDSGGIEATGYLGCGSQLTTAVATTNATVAFVLTQTTVAAAIHHGQAILTLEDKANNTWVMTSLLARSDAAALNVGAGSKSLSARLDRVRITTGPATDNFDAGAINISYR